MKRRHPFPVGTRVYHSNYLWARAVAGGMGEVKEVKGPFHGTLYEYRVAVDRDGDRAPREFWWPEWAVREALPFDYYDALKEEMSHE